MRSLQKIVIPLKKGIYAFLSIRKEWIPACAGMTLRFIHDFLQVRPELASRPIVHCAVRVRGVPLSCRFHAARGCPKVRNPKDEETFWLLVLSFWGTWFGMNSIAEEGP